MVQSAWTGLATWQANLRNSAVVWAQQPALALLGSTGVLAWAFVLGRFLYGWIVLQTIARLARLFARLVGRVIGLMHRRAP